jgi:hypothetical protein
VQNKQKTQQSKEVILNKRRSKKGKEKKNEHKEEEGMMAGIPYSFRVLATVNV